ncbi:hypothetical protein SARC_01153 [Sphaeroforma arctica JP610]|uniref:Uncharacterized protein n=1 Tax=Sphaeroforma arctica JP610 TaxID=667725 RepID=A0A0L0GCQ1_9EUKA|nr:hypothetical protein SARC_01153 [Sphaeroforma arctica JP610]KNC86684.1 hypothetical protein SARC_01153 [Sphaeroforma arctica JP610]|eukprot:XP_014160586.1 hypothetical protein SARC_01153 [Sphaeroforma arctica JP610]
MSTKPRSLSLSRKAGFAVTTSSTDVHAPLRRTQSTKIPRRHNVSTTSVANEKSLSITPGIDDLDKSDIETRTRKHVGRRSKKKSISERSMDSTTSNNGSLKKSAMKKFISALQTDASSECEVTAGPKSPLSPRRRESHSTEGSLRRPSSFEPDTAGSGGLIRRRASRQSRTDNVKCVSSINEIAEPGSCSSPHNLNMSENPSVVSDTKSESTKSRNTHKLMSMLSADMAEDIATIIGENLLLKLDVAAESQDIDECQFVSSISRSPSIHRHPSQNVILSPEISVPSLSTQRKPSTTTSSNLLEVNSDIEYRKKTRRGSVLSKKESDTNHLAVDRPQNTASSAPIRRKQSLIPTDGDSSLNSDSVASIHCDRGDSDTKHSKHKGFKPTWMRRLRKRHEDDNEDVCDDKFEEIPVSSTSSMDAGPTSQSRARKTMSVIGSLPYTGHDSRDPTGKTTHRSRTIASTGGRRSSVLPSSLQSKRDSIRGVTSKPILENLIFDPTHWTCCGILSGVGQHNEPEWHILIYPV